MSAGGKGTRLRERTMGMSRRDRTAGGPFLKKMISAPK